LIGCHWADVDRTDALHRDDVITAAAMSSHDVIISRTISYRQATSTADGDVAAVGVGQGFLNVSVVVLLRKYCCFSTDKNTQLQIIILTYLLTEQDSQKLPKLNLALRLS